MNASDANLPVEPASATMIATPALYEQVAEHLRRRIFAHEMPPGGWIDEQTLAGEFGISRTPLREALKVLAAEGLVELRPRRGCYVVELSENDLDEIFTVVAVLEAQAAASAAQRASDADIARLEGVHAELAAHAAANDVDGFFAANQRFHLAVQEIAANRYLRNTIAEARKLVKLTRRDSLRVGGRIAQSLAEHETILAAIRARDPQRASAAMQAHLLSGRAAVARLAGVPR